MPENPTLPKPAEVLGGGSKLPSPKEVFSEPKRDAYADIINDYNPEDKINEIVNSIPEMPGDHESKKKIYKDVLKKNVSPEISTAALLTLQGKHPHQEGGSKYYLNEAGIPIPLKNNERPPQGYEVASIWGSKSDAADDSWYTDLAKTVFNVLPSAAENLVDLAQTGYEAIADKPSETLNSLKNAANYLKFEKDPDINKPMLNTDGIDEFSDITDAKRWDFSPQALWGTTLGLLGSVGEMYVGGSAAAKGIKAVQGVEKLSKPAAFAATYAGSFMTNLGEARDAAEEAGLTGRDKALFSALTTAPIAAIDAKFDLGGKILSNKLMQEEKNAFIKTIAQNVAEKTAEGELTKEALDGLAKATTVGYSQLAKKWSKETTKDVLQQGGEEVAQQFMLNAGEQLWDKLTPEEKKKFGTDVFSPKSFAEYLQNGLAGMVGGVPTAFAFNKVKESAKKEAQSNTAYGIATRGPEAVDSFVENVKNEVQSGKLTKQEADNAIMQVNAYSQYHEQTKGLNLTPDENRRVFDLTFEKHNLEQNIPTEYEEQKLNAIDQAKINLNRKKAKHIQDEIDKIVLRDDVQNTAGTNAEKTKEEVKKDQEATDLLKTKVTSIEGNDVLADETAVSKETYVVPKKVQEETRSYEEIPLSQWNDPKFDTRVKQAKLADEIYKEPTKNTFGVIQQDNEFQDKGHKVDTFNVTLPDGKSIRFASSMVRKPTEDEKGGYRGNTYEENFDNRDNPIGAQVGLKVVKLKDSGRKVIFIYNNEPGPKKGKHIGMVKESLRGNSNYTKKDLEEMADLRMTNMAEPESGQEEIVTAPEPTGPTDVKIVKPKVKLGQPTRENLRKSYIEERVNQLKSEGHYSEGLGDFYDKHFGAKYDKLNPIQNEGSTEGNAITPEESTSGSNEEIKGENTPISEETETKKVRKGTKRIATKVKYPERIKALKHEFFDPYHLAMQYFIGGGKIDRVSVEKLYKGSKTEANVRSHMVLSRLKYGPKFAPTLEELAHSLWESNKDRNSAESDDYLNALESVIQDYTSVVQMAKDLNEIAIGKEQIAPIEEEVSDLHTEAEKQGLIDEVNLITDKIEELSNDEITDIADSQENFDKWEEDNDIISGEGGDVFHKSQELVYAEGQLVKADTELKAAKKALDSKRKELDKGLIADQEDLFGERKTETSLFDERASLDARNEAIVPFKQRYENAVKNYTKWQDKVKELGDSEESQLELFQRVSERKDNVEKVVEKLKKSIPSIKVVYDKNLKAAGKWSPKNKTITINPYYAGLDTPIHEYGHILIDAIGYNNKVIQAAIKQLKGTDLWKETEKRYSELNEEELGKEVLAEAIGREGANIFDKEADKSKFKVFLDYIFYWFKTKLGLNKNIAKSLAKQVLSGRGVVATEGKEQLQKVKTPEEKAQAKAERKARAASEKHSIQEKLKGREIKELPFDELIDLYNDVIGYEKSTKEKYFGQIKTQIAYTLFTKQKAKLEQWSKEGKVKGYNEEEANKSDIKMKDILMKNLAHMSQITPELQEFSKMFESTIFDMTQERYELKNELDKLGKEVIKEKNKSLGIVGRAKELFSSDNAKYFEYVENPKAELGEDEDGNIIYGPGYYTLEEGKKKGFTTAQMNFLKLMHKLNDLRNEQLAEQGADQIMKDVLKVDKSVSEAFQTEGLMQAFSLFLGNGFNLRNVRIDYNGKPMTYGEVEKKLIEQSKKGTLDKLVALKDLFKYNMAAKRQLQKGIHVDEDNENMLQMRGGPTYQINPHGALDNKFLKNRNKERGYSKDFYKAAFNFIDDYTHSKHMSELLPYIDSIEYINKEGYFGEEGDLKHGIKPNVAEWVKQWKDLHLFKTEKVGKLGPEADMAIKLLRTLTSRLVMAFNLPAGAINAFMGQYNNWRSESSKELATGHKRLFVGKDRENYGAVNKKAADILKKYQVISIDYDSNPKLFAGKLFDNLAHGLTRAGEFYIQGSMFLGLMSEKDFNSFEYKKNKDGVEELVLKPGVDEKAFKERMIAHKNRVSDIQGKYSDKDRRNFMATEFGRMVAQFKVWVPDWWKERFGDEYITADGKNKKGTFRGFSKDAFNDLREQIKTGEIFDNKDAMTNLKGALAVAVLLSLRLGADDDKKKRKQGNLLSQLTSNVLFVFDPQGLKYTVTHPVASLATLGKFVDVFEAAYNMDLEKTASTTMKVVPYNKAITKVPEEISDLLED